MLAPNAEISKEIDQFNAFKTSDWAKMLGLRPYRTELCVAWRDAGRTVSAGQIDALYVDSADPPNYYIVDFKRVGKDKILDPAAPATRQGFKGQMGLDPISDVPDTPYQHYSLQTSIYNLMLLNTYGIDVEDRMYLLRMHEDRAQFERVQCADLRREARMLLEVERDRLAAVAPTLAHTPIPDHTPDPTTDPMDTAVDEPPPPALPTAAELPRQRGRPRKHAPCSSPPSAPASASSTPSPPTAKPHGRPFKASLPQKGCCKRKQPSGDENLPSPVQPPPFTREQPPAKRSSRHAHMV